MKYRRGSRSCNEFSGAAEELRRAGGWKSKCREREALEARLNCQGRL